MGQVEKVNITIKIVKNGKVIFQREEKCTGMEDLYNLVNVKIEFDVKGHIFVRYAKYNKKYYGLQSYMIDNIKKLYKDMVGDNEILSIDVKEIE